MVNNNRSLRRKLWPLLLFFTILIFIPVTVFAQSYFFSLDREKVDVFWQEDGTLAINYVFEFTNQPSGHPIEYVDVGLPNTQFSVSDISASINGKGISFISASEYQGSGSGVALGLGADAIPPGGSGTVQMSISGITNVLFPDTQGDDYASAVFMPTYFGSEYVTGATNLEITFHLPPGVQPEEPRWHSSPQGFNSAPITGIDNSGRITYTWRNSEADPSARYEFGASFPKTYVPASAVTKPTLWQQLGIPPEAVTSILCFGGFFGFMILIVVVSVRSTRKRKMKYLPPKIRIEGHGIKRGLTAIEAAVLLERPVDKVFTMILFSLVQKNAAQVLSRDPLRLEFQDPLPDHLRPYEKQFIAAFQKDSKRQRKTDLQDMMIDLIESVGEKMKGFSHKETIRYYESIIERAWKQVEDADTPEVKSEKFNDHMGWTMLDGDFEDRTQEVFRRGPVYVPVWWHRYDPTFSRTRTGGPSPRPSGSRTRPAAPGQGLPNLPGGEFAASMATGISNFSSNVVGNITDFTSRITQKTNPIPKSSSSSGGWSSGGGSSCACACACAGCACACAGGGR